MKKCFLAFALIIAGFTSSLFSIEWGGVVNNITNASTSDFKNFPINQSNGVSFWIKSSLNKDKSLSISTELMYRYNLLVNEGKTNFTNIADFNLLMLSGDWSFGRNNLFLNVGRFPYSDISGAVFSQASDGVGVKFGNMVWNAGVYAGYTGFLNRFNVGMTDLLDKPMMDDIYDFCYGYVPVLADFTLASVNSNRLSFQLGYFLDVSKGKKNKALFEFTAYGPIGYMGNYSASLAALSENFKNVSLFANCEFTFFLSDRIVIGAGIDYTSGDHGFLAFFEPITYKPIHNSQSVFYGVDVFTPRVTGMFIFDNLCLTANEKVVLSLPRKGITLNGLDTSVSAVYNIFSDLQVGCTINAYADMVSPDYHNFSVTLNAGVAF